MNNLDEIYRQKYLKYKAKYLELKDNYGGSKKSEPKDYRLPNKAGKYVILFNNDSTIVYDPIIKEFKLEDEDDTGIVNKKKKESNKKYPYVSFNTLFDKFGDNAYWFEIQDNQQTKPFVIYKNKIMNNQNTHRIEGYNKYKTLEKQYNEFNKSCNELKNYLYYTNIECIKNPNFREQNQYKPNYNNYFFILNKRFYIDNKNFKIGISELIRKMNTKSITPLMHGCIIEIAKSSTGIYVTLKDFFYHDIPKQSSVPDSGSQ
jgi:hypothetical protein